jgi:multiple sugar transport system substrate-binding protein
MSGESSNISCPQNVRILVTDSTPEFFNFLDYHATLYQEQNPNIRISIDSVADLEDQLLQSKDWDASIFPAQLIGSLAEKEILWDLSHFIETSATLDWTEMLPFFRNPSAVYGSSSEALDEDEDGDGEAPRAIPRVIPLDGDLLSMYYRRDLFQQYNLTIPRTWEEYNQAAAFFDGMPLGPGGSPLFGSCVSRIDRCSNDYWASLILASMTQVLGTSSGFFLDPSTLSPLFGRAMEETLRIIREQFTSGHEDELTGECLASNFAFNEGNCALTYNWGNQIIVEGSALFDVGVAPTPGSQVVLDRSSRQLVECTPELCPHGVYYTDIGLVNHAPYAAFGGWVSGVADQAPEGQKYAVADFLAYVSNSQQSLGDVLPNSRSSFSQPYRYSHATSSNWIDAGFGRSLASDYTEAVRSINSENSALELRVPSAARMRNIVDQEVFEYLLETVNPGLTTEIDLRLRQESTARMEGQINDIVATLDLSDSYRRSIGYTYTPEADSQNLINEDFRDAAWGLSGLMCVVCVSLMIWTFRHRNNRVMRAFQPFLLFQSTVGLLLMSSSIIPLGFDDSWYDVDVLNITCMLSPWLYVVGFTIFFSAVYAKIRECIKIYRDPQSYSILLVDPKSCLRLCMRLLTLNGILLGLWTGLDPLRWERQEVEGGIVLEDGTVETYGTCTGGSAALVFAVLLYVLNMLIALIATLQAFKCRFLVLEYNEMQWLPLSVFPFFEVWLIGGPILPLILEDPTVVFVVISSMIFVSTVAGGMAVFAPKDWYIRKYYHSNPKGFPERTSSAGIMVLQHPTVSAIFSYFRVL